MKNHWDDQQASLYWLSHSHKIWSDGRGSQTVAQMTVMWHGLYKIISPVKGTSPL